MKYFLTLLQVFIGSALFAQIFTHTTGQYLERNGVKIYFEVTGNNKGPVLLLLHGGYGNIEDFNELLPALCNDYKIIGLDSRAHGKSTMDAKSLSYQLLQEDVEALLKTLNVDSFSIVGFSDGGIVAYRLASLTTLPIKRMVTIGSRWNIKNMAGQKSEMLQLTGEAMKKSWPQSYDTYQRLNPTPDYNLFTQQLIRMWLDSTSSGYPNEKVANIKCPILMVRGDKDDIFALSDIVELSKLLPNSTVLNVPFAGHMAFRAQKDIFLLCLKQFLKNN